MSIGEWASLCRYLVILSCTRPWLAYIIATRCHTGRWTRWDGPLWDATAAAAAAAARWHRLALSSSCRWWRHVDSIMTQYPPPTNTDNIICRTDRSYRVCFCVVKNFCLNRFGRRHRLRIRDHGFQNSLKFANFTKFFKSVEVRKNSWEEWAIEDSEIGD